MTTSTRTGTASIDGIQLYYETRGRGPALLLIAGATGDAGHFAETADALASRYTVITYDRRGNSRSVATPPTSLDQQCDDAAALLRHLNAAPAIVFGTSGGAIIALRLALRAPAVVSRLVVHEPPFIAALPQGDEMLRGFRLQLEQAVASGGVRAATEQFIRENAGNDAYEGLEPQLRERMLNNGPWLLQHELAMFLSWVPSAEELARLRVPLHVLAGTQSRAMPPHAGAEWLANALKLDLVEVPGAHSPYFTCPGDFASALHLLLRDAPPAATTAAV